MTVTLLFSLAESLGKSWTLGKPLVQPGILSTLTCAGKRMIKNPVWRAVGGPDLRGIWCPQESGSHEKGGASHLGYSCHQGWKETESRGSGASSCGLNSSTDEPGPGTLPAAPLLLSVPLLLLPWLLPLPLLILLLLPSTASNKGPTTHLLQSKSLTVSRCILKISLLWGRSYYYHHSANLGKTEAWRVYVTCSRFHSWKIWSQHLECCHPDTLYYLLIFAPVPSTRLSCLQNYFGFVPWTRFWRRVLLSAFSKGWGNCSWQSFKYFNYPWLGTRICSQNHNLMFLTTLTCWSPWKAFLICEFRFCFWNQGTGFGGLLRPMPSRYGWVFCSSNRGWALRTNGQSGTSLTGMEGQQFWGGWLTFSFLQHLGPDILETVPGERTQAICSQWHFLWSVSWGHWMAAINTVTKEVGWLSLT